MVNLSNILIIVILTYYTMYCVNLIFPKKRKIIQQGNIQLETMRKKTYKTLEEQKRFINIKYPKKIGTFKFTWKLIPSMLLQIFIFILFFQIYIYLFIKIGINLKLWQAIIIVIFLPILINYVLRKFNVEKGDLSYMMRW